ncbi:ATP-binding protein [Nostoc sp. CHAB 5834]|nr:ATP-binding protein [Nostoc sp. CHAB 5834]
MKFALFICGPAGTGKTGLAQRLATYLNTVEGMPTGIIDKDTLSNELSGAYMHSLTGDQNDRDSVRYKKYVRDLEYCGALDTARENLEVGLNCILPGPWSKEMSSGLLWDAKAMGFPEGVTPVVIWLQLPRSVRKQRIIERAHPRDAYKLKHWEENDLEPQPAPRALVFDGSLPLPQLTRMVREELPQRIDTRNTPFVQNYD